MVDRIEERIARNDAAFRAANERIRGRAEEVGGSSRIPFLCECGDLECVQALMLTAAEFTEAHSAPNRFIVLPGHTFPDVERIVASHDRYEVVEKVELDIDALWQASEGSK